MAAVNVYSQDGKKSGSIELPPDIFEAPVNERLLEQVVRMYGNNKRTGLAHTKTRAEVRGGGKKPWKQKGTGRARVSSIRSPLWRGGGTVFGPRRRTIYQMIPHLMARKALVSALSEKHKANKVMIVDEMVVKKSKTKELAVLLKKLGIENKNTLCLLAQPNKDLVTAAHNIERFTIRDVAMCNAYHVHRKQMILLDTKAVTSLQERFKRDAVHEKASS